MTPRVLLIDNYDSFTYNLAHGLMEAGARVDVFRHDAIGEAEAEALAPSHLVISPGPGRPAETGIAGDLVRRFHGRIPILGVCLGHQLIVELEGGVVDRAARLMHGKSAFVETLADDPLLTGLRSPFEAGRYHSLAAIEPLPRSLLLTARAHDGEVMAVRHRGAPTHGVQFHPESVLTPDGPAILRNFLAIGR
jgi:anthranilate synthase/aminodeoxychorismate synthase-like glutamine amidotransferase